MKRYDSRIAFNAEPFHFRAIDGFADRGQHLHAGSANLKWQARAFLFELRCVARVGDERFAIERYEQITVVAGKAGQVGHVLEVRDEQRVGLGFLDQGAQLFSADGE